MQGRGKLGFEGQSRDRVEISFLFLSSLGSISTDFSTPRLQSSSHLSHRRAGPSDRL